MAELIQYIIDEVVPNTGIVDDAEQRWRAPQVSGHYWSRGLDIAESHYEYSEEAFGL